MKPKLYIYSDCSGLEKELAFQRELLFPSDCGDFFEQTNNPDDADYFTLPFPLDLITELVGEPQYSVNFIADLQYMMTAEFRSKHFFITNDAEFPVESFPNCMFFRTAYLPHVRSLPGNAESIAPFVLREKATSIPSDNWGLISRYNSELRSRLVNVVTAMGDDFKVSPPWSCTNEPDLSTANIWLGPRRNKLSMDSGLYCHLCESVASRQSEVLDSCRFILCPLQRYGDLSDIMLSLASGRVPVIVSDECSLPNDSKVDWTEFSFLVGASHADFLKLEDISRIPQEQYQRMAQAGRLAWENHFAPPALTKRIVTALQSPERAESVSGEATGEQRPDDLALAGAGYGKSPEEESEFLKFFWESLADTYPADAGKSLILMGAGRVLKKLLSGLYMAEKTPRVAGIADDNTSLHGAIFAGMQVRALEAYQDDCPAAVVLATDTFEKQMSARVRKVFGSDTDVVSFSGFVSAIEDFDFSAYQSTPNRSWETSAVSLDDCVYGANYSVSRRLYPKKLEGLTVCVGYGDILKWTLPHNVKHFDRFVVVTSTADTHTQEIAEAAGAVVVTSDSYKESGCAFNKGRMLNAGIQALDFDDWCLTIDSDIILNENTRKLIMSRVLNDSTLYFTTRHNIPEGRREWWLEKYLQTGMMPCPPVLIGEPEPYGFFQLFHSQAPTIADAGRRVFSEDFNNAGGVDFHFSMLWANAPDCSLAYIPLKTLHVPHGHWGVNWSGRKSEALGHHGRCDVGTGTQDGWKQIAYHSASNITFVNDLPEESGYLKYTRSDTGEAIIFRYDAGGDDQLDAGLVLGVKLAGVFCCGVSGGQTGDVILMERDGRELSGWGVGRLKNSNISARCWNGRLMTSVSDFDMSYCRSLSSSEKELLVEVVLYGR